MAIVLDADVIIRGEKGSFDLQRWMRSFPEERFEVAAITIAELWHGVERATEPHKSTRLRYLDAFLPLLPVIAYTEQIAREHARIWAQLQRAGKMIGYYDLIVAATALERARQVATFNKKHFSLVKGLMIVEPE